MSVVLKNMLNAREPVYSLTIKSLEAASGYRHIDLGLVSEITSQTRQKIKMLGLDPEDTTVEELEAVLRTRAAEDDIELSRAFQGDVLKMLLRLESKAPTVLIPVVKPAVLKHLLTIEPAKKVMQAFGYRSVDSMLKRAPLNQVLAGAFLLEGVVWHRKFIKSLKNLKPTDISMARPSVIALDKRLTKDSNHRQVVTIQCAALAVVPTLAKWPGCFIYSATLASEGLFHVHVRGMLIKSNQFKGSCVKQLAELTYSAPARVGEIGKISVSWPALYKSISKDPLVIKKDDIIDRSDFAWSSSTKTLPLLSQRINFWNTEYLAFYNNARPLSLNINDIAYNLYYRVPLRHSTNVSMQRELKVELQSRYISVFPLRSDLMNKAGLN